MKATHATNNSGRILLTIALIWLAGCEKTATVPTQAVNDFPTQARVEYVMQCMQEHGGQNYDNLYHCVCMVDQIGGSMPYEDFAQAQTFTYLFNTPGERGGEFRDPPQSEKLRSQLKQATAKAAETCFPNTAKVPSGKK